MSDDLSSFEGLSFDDFFQKSSILSESSPVPSETMELEMQEFNEEFDSRLRPKLEALEQVRGDLNKEGISVPGIVVCGAQSAGKSSVMEYLSDLNFPRAENTCTRCPTIVSLVADPTAEKAYALIGLEAKRDKQERIDDLSKFGTKIEELTDKLTAKIGKGSGVITKEPIHVTVVRPSGPTLTLIDIPGITHMCTDGVQSDIHEVTKNMVESYIKDPNMVVLVVIPATDDFGNAEALKLAKEHDPHGTRTLGVVTKSDLVKSDSDIVQRIKMEGKNIQLELGFIALRCRTPSEVKKGVTRVAAMGAEESLFNTHPLLSQLMASQWGLRKLVSQIVSVQAERVETFIPEIKQLLSTRLMDAESELERLAPACATEAARSSRMNEMVRRIDLDLHDILSGARHFEDKKLHLPAMWVELADEFSKVIRKATPDYLSDEYMDKLKVSLKEVQGVAPPNFMSSPVFCKSLADIFFAKATSTNAVDGILLTASKTMVFQMQDALQEALELKVDEYITDFPRLNDFVKDRILELLKKQSRIAVHHFEALLKAERAKPFTFNHYYMDTVNKVRSAVMSRSRSLMGVAPERQAVRIGDRVTPSGEWATHHAGAHKTISLESKGTVMKTREDQTADVKWDGGDTTTSLNGKSGYFTLQLLGTEANGIEGVTEEFIEGAAKNFAKGESNYEQAVKDMQISLFSYSKVVLKCVLDDVPKLIWSELMYTVNVELSGFIKEPLSDAETLEKLMAEDHVKASQRKRQELTVTRLKDSLKILRRIK